LGARTESACDRDWTGREQPARKRIQLAPRLLHALPAGRRHGESHRAAHARQGRSERRGQLTGERHCRVHAPGQHMTATTQTYGACMVSECARGLQPRGLCAALDRVPQAGPGSSGPRHSKRRPARRARRKENTRRPRAPLAGNDPEHTAVHTRIEPVAAGTLSRRSEAPRPALRPRARTAPGQGAPQRARRSGRTHALTHRRSRYPRHPLARVSVVTGSRNTMREQQRAGAGREIVAVPGALHQGEHGSAAPPTARVHAEALPAPPAPRTHSSIGTACACRRHSTARSRGAVAARRKSPMRRGGPAPRALSVRRSAGNRRDCQLGRRQGRRSRAGPGRPRWP